MLKDYIDFNNKDVLFLYSTLLINDSFTLKQIEISIFIYKKRGYSKPLTISLNSSPLSSNLAY